ncbi:hypothetical protein, partial [Vibrio parahaemolyticus]
GICWYFKRSLKNLRQNPFVGRSQLSQRAFIVSNNQRCAVAKRDRAEFYGIEAKFYFFHESADRLNYFRKGKDSAL